MVLKMIVQVCNLSSWYFDQNKLIIAFKRSVKVYNHTKLIVESSEFKLLIKLI